MMPVFSLDCASAAALSPPRRHAAARQAAKKRRRRVIIERYPDTRALESPRPLCRGSYDGKEAGAEVGQLFFADAADFQQLRRRARQLARHRAQDRVAEDD